MSKKDPKYRITPSLLNSFQTLLDSDLLWQKFYGDNENSNVTAVEYYAKCEQELLDACNRVPFTSEAASKGTALNEIVDCILDKRPQREDMKVERIYSPMYGVVKGEPSGGDLIGLHAELDGFKFNFDINLINRLTEYFAGSICQYRCEATLDTSYGPVILYGDADYIRKDVVSDLKSTSKYSEYGKFDSGWQKHLYPWALIKSGDAQYISGFEYTIIPWQVGGTKNLPLLTGEIYKEWHDFSYNESEELLLEIVEQFIHWIEVHRNLIKHPRIFNQQ